MRTLPAIAWSSLLLAATSCGGTSGKKEGDQRSPPSGIRITVAASSSAADVWSGAEPDPETIWSLVYSPATYGFVKRGTIGPGAGPYEFPQADPYYLILVAPGAVSTSSTTYLRVDAIQRLSDSLYWSGRGAGDHAAYGSNTYDENEPFRHDVGLPTWAYGAPDGRCLAVFGWTAFPTADWLP